MKKAITALGIFGIIIVIVLSLGSIYVIAPPFSMARTIIAKNTNSEPFSEIQKTKIEAALHEGGLVYESEKKYLKSQASYARYSLFFMAVACLIISQFQSRQNIEKPHGTENKNGA